MVGAGAQGGSGSRSHARWNETVDVGLGLKGSRSQAKVESEAGDCLGRFIGRTREGSELPLLQRGNSRVTQQHIALEDADFFHSACLSDHYIQLNLPRQSNLSSHGGIFRL